MDKLRTVFRVRILLLITLALAWLVSPPTGALATTFIPEQPVMPTEELRPGMKGYMLTVLRGTEPVELPIEVVSVIPQRGPVRHLILTRLLPSEKNSVGGLAQGMSGSPVYVDGRLIGAISMGWSFGDHTMAMVMPINDMARVFSWPDDTGPGGALMMLGALKSSPLKVSGLSGRAVTDLQSTLGIPLEAVPFGANGELPLYEGRFSPGDAISVFLAWGDVEMSAVGTVTATSRDGRFLSFGHPFLGRGAVNFPVARAMIHDTVFSQVFPFKIASPIAMMGTATQDRASGLGGRMGHFTPSIAASLVFQDMDTGGERVVRNFRVVPDAFLSARLLAGIYGGLLDQQWGRTGEGTANVTLRVDGRGIPNGWTRSNVFFSDRDVGSAAVREVASIIDTIMLQPFQGIYPIGFRLDVSVTRNPRVLFIEDVVVVPSDAAPGDILSVEVTLRPWRRDPIRRSFEITVPENATGNVELIVRGGSSNSFSQQALDGGWKSIDNFQRLLTEINAFDANNELILELNYDRVARALADGQSSRAELIQEEREFLSETKARRLEEGTLRISRSEYVIDGFMRRLINLVENTDD